MFANMDTSKMDATGLQRQGTTMGAGGDGDEAIPPGLVACPVGVSVCRSLLDGERGRKATSGVMDMTWANLYLYLFTLVDRYRRSHILLL